MCVFECTCLSAYSPSCPTSVPTRWRRTAAWANGSRDDADRRNHDISILCDELLGIDPRPPLPPWCGSLGDSNLRLMNTKDRGDVVEAALAAAGSANAAEEHVADPVGHPNWIREDPDVVVGARGQGDMVTDWIQDKLYEIECTRQGKRPRRA